MKANDPERRSIRRYGQVTPNRFRTIQAPDPRSQCVRSRRRRLPLPYQPLPQKRGVGEGAKEAAHDGIADAPPSPRAATSADARARRSRHAAPSSTRGGGDRGRRAVPRGTTGAEPARAPREPQIARFRSGFGELAAVRGRVARMEFSDPPRRSYVPDIFPKVLLTGGVLPAILRARGVTWASPKKRCLRRLVPFR